METLTSRKLIACIVGIASIVMLFSVAAFAPNPEVIADKYNSTLIAIGSIVGSAIGVQGVIDVLSKNTSNKG